MGSTAKIVASWVLGLFVGIAARELLIRALGQRTVQAAEWSSQEERLAALSAQLGAARSEAAKAGEQLQAAQASHGALEAEREQVRDELQRSLAQLKEAQARVGDDAAQLDAAAKRQASVEAQLQAARGELDAARRQGAAASAERDAQLARALSRDEAASLAARESLERLHAAEAAAAAARAELARQQDEYGDSLALLRRTPDSAVAFYGEALGTRMIARGFEPCDEAGNALAAADGMPQVGAYARALAFVNVHEVFPAPRLLHEDWSPPAVAGALQPGEVVRIEEVRQHVWGGSTWIRFQAPARAAAR